MRTLFGYRVGSHVGSMCFGAVVAVAVTAVAAPSRDDKRFHALDSFAQVLANVGGKYVHPVDDRVLLRNAARGMVAGLDQYSAYLTPEQYRQLRQDTDGEFGGVGVTFGSGRIAPGEVPTARNIEDAELVIDSVIANSPADRAGLQFGDHVVAVDGDLVAMEGVAVANPDKWEALLRGSSGTRVRITIRRLGWKAPRDMVLVREQLKTPSVEHLAVEAGIGYVAIARFAEATAADTKAALEKLRASGNLRGLVLDLRGDPGGLVDAGIAVADLFLSSGTIVTMHGRDPKQVERHVAHAAGTLSGFPMVCLVDEGTASAAEIVVGALRDHKRCTVVGMPTYGKGSVQTFFDLDDGGGLKLTTELYRSPSGTSFEGTGISPDVQVELGGEEIVVGEDDEGSDEDEDIADGEGELPTPSPASSPGADVTVDARIRNSLADDPQFDAALGILRRSLT